MGLRAALRQDPDVIMIGEMRDAETVDTAIKAAETGHLLISTLHTPDAQSTILRIMAMFPPEEQEVVRIRLSESLHSVVSQRLLPRADGKGRAVAAEVLDRDARGARHDRRRQAHRRDPRLHRRRARPVRHADVRPAPGRSGAGRATSPSRRRWPRRRIRRTSRSRCGCSAAYVGRAPKMPGEMETAPAPAPAGRRNDGHDDGRGRVRVLSAVVGGMRLAVGGGGVCRHPPLRFVPLGWRRGGR